MADAFVSAIVGPVFENLISLLKREFKSIKNVKKEVDRLLRKLSIIKLVLEDAEEKQVNDKAIHKWLIDLKDATYDAEDVLDEWSLKIQQEQEFSNRRSTNQVCLPLSSCLNSKKIIFRREMAKKLKEIFSTFEQIEMQKSNLLTPNGVSQSESQSNRQRETSSQIIESHIYGREADRNKIVDILVNDVGSQQDVCVLPIVGMGGLGKTTLAQSVYNDERTSCFGVKIWVCVSETSLVERLLKTIIQNYKGETCNLTTLEAIQKEVANMLKDKKYLIVLDDLWSTDQDFWMTLKASLVGGAKGSAIIITTRLEEVASLTHTLEPCSLKGLSNDDCWSIFKDRAFVNKNVEDGYLIEIGMAIAEKCKGIPLAAKSLGSLLGSKTDKGHWERVRDNDVWKLQPNNLLPILRLSYNKIPSDWKQCFAYCSIFPKDWEIEKNKLIYLWNANGYIQSQEGVEIELEEIGDDIFNQLLRWSFFQETIEDEYGNISTCKMHDLMHDLACSVAVNECFNAKLGVTKQVPQKIRHLSVDLNSTNIDPLLKSQSSLRTLVLFHPIDIHSFEFPCTLRVLGLSCMSLKTLPPSVCNLKHLRYLDLSCNDLACLPESIHKLRNLQMLDLSWNEDMTSLPLSIGSLEQLRYLNLCSNSKITSLPDSVLGLRNLQSLLLYSCWKLKNLPERLGNMTSLKHLDLRTRGELVKMPVGIGRLTRLETLGQFVVGKPSDGECGSMSELQGLKQLRGVLEIRGLENVRNPEDAKMADLGNKQYLRELKLNYDEESEQQSDKKEDVLQGLQLPPNIKELEILGWETCFGNGFVQNLTSLESVTIYNCRRIKCLPVMRMPSLVKLDIFRCDKLTSVSEGLQHLTSLKELSIRSCLKLVFGEDDFQNLISLRNLSLWFLPNVTAVPESVQNLTMLRSLCIEWCPNVIRLTEGLKHLTSLVHLRLRDLPKLTASPPEWMQHLTMLKSLKISNCPHLELEAHDFHNLISLQSLSLWSLPQLTCLPEGIQYLPRLQQLDIWNCENLQTLPQWIKHLTTLQSLTIRWCHPELEANCNRETGGEYWPLISHIPLFDIYT